MTSLPQELVNALYGGSYDLTVTRDADGALRVGGADGAGQRFDLVCMTGEFIAALPPRVRARLAAALDARLALDGRVRELKAAWEEAGRPCPHCGHAADADIYGLREDLCLICGRSMTR